MPSGAIKGELKKPLSERKLPGTPGGNGHRATSWGSPHRVQRGVQGLPLLMTPRMVPATEKIASEPLDPPRESAIKPDLQDTEPWAGLTENNSALWWLESAEQPPTLAEFQNLLEAERLRWATSLCEFRSQQTQAVEAVGRNVELKFGSAMDAISRLSGTMEVRLRDLRTTLEACLGDLERRWAAGRDEETEEERSELVRVVAAICSDVQELQGQQRQGAEELRVLQRRQEGALEDLQSDQRKFLSEAQSQLTSDAWEIQSQLSGDMSQLMGEVEALRGLQGQQAGGLEAVQEQLQARCGGLATELRGELEAGLRELRGRLQREAQELRKLHGAVSGSVEALRGSLADEARSQLRGSVEALRESLLPELRGQLQDVQSQVALELQAIRDERSDMEELKSQGRGELELLDLCQGLKSQLAHDVEALRHKHGSDLEELRRQHRGQLEELRRQHTSDVEALRRQQQQGGRAAETARVQLVDDVDDLRRQHSETSGSIEELQSQHAQCEAVQAGLLSDVAALKDQLTGCAEAAGPAPERPAAGAEAPPREGSVDLKALRTQQASLAHRVQELWGSWQGDGREALRGEIRRDVEAVCRRDLETARRELRADLQQLQLQVQPKRWSLLDAVQSQISCQHGGTLETLQLQHGRDIEALWTETRDLEAELQQLGCRHSEELEALKDMQGALGDTTRSELQAEMQALGGRLSADLASLRDEGAGAGEQQLAAALQLQAAHSEAGQARLVSDVIALRSQLMNSVKALQIQQSRQGAELEALRGRQGELAARCGREAEELRAEECRLAGELEALSERCGAGATHYV